MPSCPQPWGNVTAKGDWPNQAVYVMDLLQFLVKTSTNCLNESSVLSSVVDFLNFQSNSSISGTFFWTWDVFQFQYYDMPRKPGDRIESPDTLGRKCWAFAYLTQLWQGGASPLRQSLRESFVAAGFDISNFASTFDNSIPPSFRLCEEVMANCFENSTYTPSRNGTCPAKIFDFHVLGFDRENLLRDNIVKYTFR